MRISVRPGKYVVAVSGGVDSMVLLDLLFQQNQPPTELPSYKHPTLKPPSGRGPAPRSAPIFFRITENKTGAAPPGVTPFLWGSEPGHQLIVAHFDHGIRPDSNQDHKLVERVAKRYGLPFVTAEGRLGSEASEAEARTARYAFLGRVMEEQGAEAIITAHHQDDVLETVIINLLRGTRRLGLSSLRDRRGLLRPLLGYTKEEIRGYATAQGLKWREDSTNNDDRYLRNYIRHHVLTRLDAASRATLLAKLRRAGQLNQELDELLEQDLARQPQSDQLDRHWFISLPHAVAKEVMAAWLRRNAIRGFDQQLIERLVAAAKIYRPGRSADVDGLYQLEFAKHEIKLVPRSS